MSPCTIVSTIASLLNKNLAGYKNSRLIVGAVSPLFLDSVNLDEKSAVSLFLCSYSVSVSEVLWLYFVSGGWALFSLLEIWSLLSSPRQGKE